MKVSIVIPHHMRRIDCTVRHLNAIHASAQLARNEDEEEYRVTGVRPNREVEILVACNRDDWRLPHLVQAMVAGSPTEYRVVFRPSSEESPNWLAGAYQSGVQAAVGNYVTFLGQGSSIVPGYVSALMRALQLHTSGVADNLWPSAVLVQCNGLDGQYNKWRLIPGDWLQPEMLTQDHLRPMNLVVRRHVAQQYSWTDFDICNSPTMVYDWFRKIQLDGHAIRMSSNLVGWHL